MVVHSWDAYEGDALGVPVTASRLGAADGEVGSGACDGLARPAPFGSGGGRCGRRGGGRNEPRRVNTSSAMPRLSSLSPFIASSLGSTDVATR